MQAASWSQLTPSGSTPPARSGHAAVFDSNAVNMWLGSGEGFKIQDLHTGRMKNPVEKQVELNPKVGLRDCACMYIHTHRVEGLLVGG